MTEILSQLLVPFAALGFIGMAAVGVFILLAIGFSFAERGWAAFLFLIGSLASLAYFSDSNPLSFIAENPSASIAWVAGYLAVGSAWSIARFWLYASGLKLAFRDFRDQWLSLRSFPSVEAMSEQALVDFRNAAQAHMREKASYGRYPVSPGAHKAAILFWMGWWPVSMLSYALDEPIRRLLEAIYRTFSGVYSRIARREASEYLAAMGHSDAPKKD